MEIRTAANHDDPTAGIGHWALGLSLRARANLGRLRLGLQERGPGPRRPRLRTITVRRARFRSVVCRAYVVRWPLSKLGPTKVGQSGMAQARRSSAVVESQNARRFTGSLSKFPSVGNERS